MQSVIPIKNHRLLSRSLDFLDAEQNTRIVFHTLEATLSICLLANIIHLAQMEDEETLKSLLYPQFVVWHFYFLPKGSLYTIFFLWAGSSALFAGYWNIVSVTWPLNSRIWLNGIQSLAGSRVMTSAVRHWMSSRQRPWWNSSSVTSGPFLCFNIWHNASRSLSGHRLWCLEWSRMQMRRI